MAQNDEGRRDSGGGSVCGVDHVWRGLEISLNAGDGGLGGGHIFVFFFFCLANLSVGGFRSQETGVAFPELSRTSNLERGRAKPNRKPLTIDIERASG